MAEKRGYRMRPAEDISVVAGELVTVDLELESGQNPDDLHVKVGTLVRKSFHPGPRIPDAATIPLDATG